MIEALHRLPTNVGMTLQSMRETIKKIAHKLFTMGPGGKTVEHMFILGKGAAHPVALEGSLKIKEISYIHAEGYPGGALKHGPYALIEKGAASPPPTRSAWTLSLGSHTHLLCLQARPSY